MRTKNILRIICPSYTIYLKNDPPKNVYQKGVPPTSTTPSIMDTLFPPNLISGSVKTQKQLDAALAKHSDLSISFVTIAVNRPETRKWYEHYWQKIHRYLDKDFAQKFRLESEHESRGWEFHIASVLLDHGVNLKEKTWNTGPDFCIQTPEGRNIWIEAICCTSGEVDPVPPKPDLTEGKVYIGGGGIEDLNRPRVLRILNAVGTKYEKFKRYVADGKSGVSENDCLIIAISGANIEFASDSEVLLKRAVFGVGLDTYYKDPKTNKLVGPFYKPSPNIIKKAKIGDKIMPANFMEMEGFSNINAVLYCGHHAYNCERNGHKVGDDFLFAYHVNPTNSLPVNLFNFGLEIRKNPTDASITTFNLNTN